jgi:hypothetical protein
MTHTPGGWRTCQHEYRADKDGVEFCRHCGNDRDLLEANAALLAACELGFEHPLRNMDGPTLLLYAAGALEAIDALLWADTVAALRAKAVAEDAARERARGGA